MGALASDWRLSGNVSGRSGSWLTVDTGTTGDARGNGIRSQRVNQISDDVYGPGADRGNFDNVPRAQIENYLNRAAFELPAAGTYGNHEAASIEGPRFWNIDLAVARLIRFTAAQSLELRVEVFNLLNTFNWGNPATDFRQANFGRITSQSGAPRIFQFGIKYGF
jgi:hypothetical protein